MKPVRACRHLEGVAHSCEYVERRNRLIPTAMLEAERIGHAYEGPAREQGVARAFFAAMDRLAVEYGLVDSKIDDISLRRALVVAAEASSKWGSA